MTATVFTTGEDAELIPKLMINGGKVVAYCLPLGVLLAGDALDVSCELQVTNNNSKEAMVGFQLWLSSTPTIAIDPISNNPVGCLQLDHGNCTNVTPTQHHYTISKNAKYKVGTAMASAYVLMVVNSAWSYSPQSGAFLLVDSGNGSLMAIVHRNS